MGGKFLPPYLRLVFDYQDDEQDRLQADIQKTRSDRHKTDIEDGVVTIRVAREQALSDGDLTRAQFEQLELEDGNLPDGESVLTLYSSLDPFFIEHLDLGTDDPLAIEANDPLEMLVEINEAALNVQDVLANSVSGKERRLAQQASSALGQLKEIYEQISIQNIVTEQQAVEGQAPQPGVEGQEPENEEPEPEEETEEKGFNFGAKVGETIAGQLARGEGGRFANAAEVAAARNELLANLIARLRAKRGGGDRDGAVAARKAVALHRSTLMARSQCQRQGESCSLPLILAMWTRRKRRWPMLPNQAKAERVAKAERNPSRRQNNEQRRSSNRKHKPATKLLQKLQIVLVWTPLTWNNCSRSARAARLQIPNQHSG
jgi:hypothetical protein